MLEDMDISFAKCLGETRREAGRVCGIFEENPYYVGHGTAVVLGEVC